MLFHSADFLAFLTVVLALFYAVPFRFGKIVLLLASYFFYMCWNPKFIVLIWTLTAIDYAAGIVMGRVRPDRRKLVVIASLAANLGLLGFFKYYNFFAGSVAALLGKPSNSFLIDVVLPLGISFHTFQSMSYVIDVYRGVQAPIRNALDYALFIAFFPQLVAGPIVRAREFFGQLYNWKRPSAIEVQDGILLFLVGFTKKIVFADQFAKVADGYFHNVYASPGMLDAWSASFAFAMQIFFDFSGYTDMAIGCARLLGFELPENFARPYLAASITEFWRRWHMSLSRWLRDYLYIPLGGNRHGKVRTYRNLMVTMLLGGLWHGASWNFLVWGGWHGAWLSIEKAFGLGTERGSRWGWTYPPRALATFVIVLLGWVLFRAPGLDAATFVYRQMLVGPRGSFLLKPGHVVLAVIALALALFEEKKAILTRFTRLPAPVQAAALTVLLVCLELFSVTDEKFPFIYFQF